MARNFSTWWVIGAAAGVVALPFLLRSRSAAPPGASGDAAVVRVITPHNEAIRHEFGVAFARWHAERFGRPARVEWVVVGGTSEMARYLEAQYVASVRAWWKNGGRPWPTGAEEAMLNPRFDATSMPDAAALAALHQGYRATDDPAAFTVKVDVLFGGGVYDHQRATGRGFLVAPWSANAVPAGVFADAAGHELIPARLGGEVWRSDTFFGAAASAFGICVNTDRLRELGIGSLPAGWVDLGGPAYAGQLALADPTKSGSFAKMFEIILQEQCARAVAAAGFTETQVEDFEARYKAAGTLAPGAIPDGVPRDYPDALEQGWQNGVKLVRRLGANARYFTDSAGRVPVDVAAGQVAAGLAIDFYARTQGQTVAAGAGRDRMEFIVPRGASGVGVDPIALLRGAEHRATAVRFIEFVLGAEGQRLWNQRAGTPGGPEKYTLYRMPVRRDFYPSDVAAFQAAYAAYHPHAADDPAGPGHDPYVLAAGATYRARWTASHFGPLRDLVKAMCLDSGDELRAAWRAILEAGGPEACPAALAAFERLPEHPLPLTWENAPRLAATQDRRTYLREWTAFFRAQYREAAARAARPDPIR